MIRKPSFLLGLFAAILGGSSSIATPPPAVVSNPFKRRARRPRGGSILGIRSGNAPAFTSKDEARLAARAERDLRACRLNYPGWCGFEESGVPA